jgi:hypothetical protein
MEDVNNCVVSAPIVKAVEKIREMAASLVSSNALFKRLDA